MPIQKGQHGHENCTERGGGEEIHPPRGLAFARFGNQVFQGHGGEPVKETLQKGNAGCEVFEFPIVAEKAHGAGVAEAFQDGGVAVGEEHGASDGSYKDGNDFETERGEEHVAAELFEDFDLGAVGGVGR